MASITLQPNIAALQATSSLSGKKYFACKFGTTDKLITVAGAREGFGVIQDDAPSAAGDSVEVALPGGGSLVKLGGSVTRGDSITPDSNGEFVTATAGQRALGIAMQSGVDADVIDAILLVHAVPV